MDIAALTFEEKKKRLIGRSALVIFGIFFINYAAMTFFWYSSIWWFDMPMHFLGGFWIGMTAIWLAIFGWGNAGAQAAFRRSLFAALIAIAVFGVAWELFEYGIDTWITHMPHNNLDTFSDLCFDLAGACASAAYLARRGYIGRE